MTAETEQLVSLREVEYAPEFLLLTPGYYPARRGPTHGRILTPDQIIPVLENCMQSTYVSVDLETQGGDYSTDIRIVGLGLAWDHGSAYINWADVPQSLVHTELNKFFTSHKGLIAHNVYFDSGVLITQLGVEIDWYACTYALLAMTANEGYPGQGWGLKKAQKDLLQWEDTNEGQLDEWLCVNGYYKGVRRIDSSPEALQSYYSEGKLKPDKGEMWRAPEEVLGKYCILDAESTYLLFTEVLQPVLDRFPALYEFHKQEFLVLIRHQIEQKILGIPMDVPGLQRRKEELEKQIEALSSSFCNHPEVVPAIRDMEEDMLTPLLTKEINKYNLNGEISKNYTNWLRKIEEARSGLFAEYKFNIQSGTQLRTLLYDKLGYPVRAKTEKGQAATDIQSLKHMGEIGSLLVERMYLAKELSYVDKYIELTENRNTIHPSFRTPGTITGRLSSKDPNMQQISKTKKMMELFIARPGMAWVDLDFSALEPVVLTEFSQDRNLLAIYGNGRPKNDIYLFVGANIPGVIGDKIRATGYDPYNPTKEALARAKKECKHERGICKTVTLACIAKNTPIRVRNKGWVPIELVVKGDEVWDGFKWVTTDGAIFKGIKQVINLHDIKLTRDHKVLGEDNVWREAEKYSIPERTNTTQPLRPNKPSATWSDVWALGSYIIRSYTRKWISKSFSSMQMWLSDISKL